MEVKYLRIGNYVETFGTNGHPDAWVTIEVMPYHIETCLSNPELFRPIPLAILNYPPDQTIYIHKYSAKIRITREGNKWAIRLKRNNTYCLIKWAENIHELQNLFMDITGEDLEIKPPGEI